VPPGQCHISRTLRPRIVVHPVIDAALALRQEPGFALKAIERIVVRGHPLLAARADRPNVTTGREAQVSLQHSVAAALLFGEASLAQYTDACVRGPAVLALRAKVYVERDETIDVSAAALHMLTKDGASRIVSVPAARGSHVRPLADREIEDKLRSLATTAHNIQPLIDAAWALDRADDASLPIRLLRRVRLQERTQMAYGQWNSILCLLPWEESHLRVRR
jgi:2-methylcitrate dehydratase PrpD